MKTLGTTTDGKYIVEMEREEYAEFINLEASLVGYAGYSPFDNPRNFRGIDLSPVFKALSDLSTAKHSITTLQSYINNLASYFGKVEIPKDKEIDDK